MPTNIDVFLGQLTLETTLLFTELDKQYLTLVTLIVARIIRRTPVDTGNAMGNWIASREGPIVAEPIPLPASANRDTLSDAMQSLSSLRVIDTVHISNNAEYISFLEDGTGSGQAPNGMVALTFSEFENTIIE